ncbi:hypothetical protein D9M69_371790 [compost metagenome]
MINAASPGAAGADEGTGPISPGLSSRPPNRRCSNPGLATAASLLAMACRACPWSTPSSASRAGNSRGWRARSSMRLANCLSPLRTSRGSSRSSRRSARPVRALTLCSTRCWRRCSESSTAFSSRGISAERPASICSPRMISRSSCMHWSTALSAPSAARELRTRPRRSRSRRASQRFSSFSCCSRLSRYLAFQRWGSSLMQGFRARVRSTPGAGRPATRRADGYPPPPAGGRKSAG